MVCMSFGDDAHDDDVAVHSDAEDLGMGAIDEQSCCRVS